jgi:hypothetical protein
MRRRFVAFVSMTMVVLTYGLMASAEVSIGDPPQLSVECTGWHAVCALATDCKVDQNQADCACWKVKEPHVVATTNIKNDTFGGAPVKEQTQSECTKAHPCDVDQAPVCKAIKELGDGQYVSTFSYRGWCKKWDPVKCEGENEGPWADCMTSLCTEIQDPKNPQRPLSCQCTVNYGPFVGTHGRCRTKKGTVMSTIPEGAWNFKRGTFSFPMPGDEYVKEACAPLKSDSPTGK